VFAKGFPVGRGFGAGKGVGRVGFEPTTLGLKGCPFAGAGPFGGGAGAGDNGGI